MRARDLKTLRRSLGLSQATLAEMLGLTQPTVSNYESGATPIPGPVRKLVEMMEKKKLAAIQGER